MAALIPQVHLIICMDPRVAPGPVLHALDVLRAKEWQTETVLVCDLSWKKYISAEQSALYLDRKQFFHSDFVGTKNEIVKVDALEDFLAKLDDFEITQLTQVGELSWGRWLQTYFDEEEIEKKKHIEVRVGDVAAIEVANQLAEGFNIDLAEMVKINTKSDTIYIDPYVEGEVSTKFMHWLDKEKVNLPEWCNVICNEEDKASFEAMGLEENLIVESEIDAHLFNQGVVVFDEDSPFAQASRSFNVAYCSFSEIKNPKCIYIPGDIACAIEDDLHWVEFLNLLTYWKKGRLRELAFQWNEMPVSIQLVEGFGYRMSLKSLNEYSSDLIICKSVVASYTSHQGPIKERDVIELHRSLMKTVHNDPYLISFSIKLLIMIAERMIASASQGERLFQRLGSDYHRIVVGEALVEGIIESKSKNYKEINIHDCLKSFHQYLMKLDYYNDQLDSNTAYRES